MKRCMRCGCDSAESTPRCWHCGQIAFVPTNQAHHWTERPGRPGRPETVSCGNPPPRPRRRIAEPASPGMVRLTAGLAVVCGLVLAVLLASRLARLSRLEGQLAAQFAESAREHQAEEEQGEQDRRAQIEREEAAHRARLSDPAFLSGALASNRHQTEWKRRLAHDRRMAATTLETNLLYIDRLGQDKQMTAKEALETVTRLAAPVRSRVEVSPQEDGFVVCVAFPMSVLTQDEAGAVTKHHSKEAMRREIEQLSARVMRDLYDSCGWRGIRKVSVSCNHALRRPFIPPGATPEEEAALRWRAPVEMGRLYRVSLAQDQARAVSDWRRLSTPRLVKMVTVEYDGVKRLTITHDSGQPAYPMDPSGPLEF